jgi:ribosome maturation factor RimP
MAHFLFAVNTMLRAPENIRMLIHKPVEALGYELVGVEISHRGSSSMVLRVYIDHETGITLDDCGTVSHQLSGILDVTDLIVGRYTLEVSSPGLDRPLFELEHFARFQGRKIRVGLAVPVHGRRKLHGILLNVDGEEVLVKEGDVVHRIPFGQIETARLVPDFGYPFNLRQTTEPPNPPLSGGYDVAG